jgi:hypothetical protein
MHKLSPPCRNGRGDKAETLFPVCRFRAFASSRLLTVKNPGDLLREALGGEFDPTYYTDYLEEKYSKIYNL